MSSTWAEENGIELEDNIALNGTEVEVIGIFTSETKFGGRSIFIPVELAQIILAYYWQLSPILNQNNLAIRRPKILNMSGLNRLAKENLMYSNSLLKG